MALRVASRSLAARASALGRGAAACPSGAARPSAAALAASASWSSSAPFAPALSGVRHLSWFGGGSDDSKAAPSGDLSGALDLPASAAGANAEALDAAASEAASAAAGGAAQALSGAAPADTLTQLLSSSTAADSIVALAQAAEAEAAAEALEDCWLPSRLLQRALLGLHENAGLPWLGTLAVATAALRLATWPTNIAQMRRAQSVAKARPLLEDAVEKFQAAQRSGDPDALRRHQERIAEIWKKYDCHPVKMLAPMLVQMPVFLGMFGALRALSTAKLPSLVDGGVLWCTDLTVADPTYALPALTCLSFLAMIELGAADGMEAQSADQRKKFKMFMRLLGIVILPISASMPASLHVYWTASNIIGITQARILRIPAVRAAFKLPPLKGAAAAAAASTPGFSAAAANAAGVVKATPVGQGKPRTYARPPTKKHN